MSGPVVTVLMTAFNRERYIASAIDSVLAQTFGDFELVIVDDHSTDRTVAVATRYATDPRVRIIVNERNLGDYPNRNHAASFARGAFFKYHDSDDVMYPHCLEVMVRALEGEPTASLALTGPSGWAGGPAPMLLTPRLAYQREFFGQGLFRLGPACALFRRDAWPRLGGFPEVGPHSDTIFWMRLCARENVLLVPGDLFWYRTHEGQQLHHPRASFDYAEIERFYFHALTSPECPLDAAERDAARRNLTFGIAKKMLRDVRRRQFRLAAHRFLRSGAGPADWVRYLRRPTRNWTAGTPPLVEREVGVASAAPAGNTSAQVR